MAPGLQGQSLPRRATISLATGHPFARLVLRSDGYTACLGAHGGNDGAVIAVGTGTIGFQVEAGQESRVGGWGFPHGDEGGGAWLGLEAIRKTLQWLDGRAAADPLLDAVHARFDGDLSRLVVWANTANSTEFGEIAPMVLAHVGQRTPLALLLMREAARELDRIGQALAAKSRRPLPCCMLGGLGSFVEPYLEKTLRARLVPDRDEPVQGALLMIRADVAAGDKVR